MFEYPICSAMGHEERDKYEPTRFQRGKCNKKYRKQKKVLILKEKKIYIVM